MIIEKKLFEKGMNSDINVRELPNGYMLNCMNARMGVSQYGRSNRLENIPGTIEITNNVVPPYGYNQCIGSAVDPASNKLVYALWNSFGHHGIYALDISTRQIYVVVYDSQITEGLNFSRTSRIDRNAYVINGLFYFCENQNNQPRVIDIDAGIKFNHPSYITDAVPYAFPLSFDEITLLKRSCALAPVIQKSTDTNFENNFIENESFEFAFMYGWYNGETSVVGSYSRSSRLNKTDDDSNFIVVQMDEDEVIPSRVRYVYLVVRFSNTNNAYIVKTWDREVSSENTEIENQNDAIGLLTFNFYNNLTGTYIPISSVLKQADAVPIYTKTVCPVRNRMFLGNNLEGYDTPGTTSLTTALNESDLSAGASIIKNLIEVRARVGVPGGSNDYNYGGWYVYIDSVVQTGYYLITGSELTSVTGVEFTWLTIPALAAAPTTIALSGLDFIGVSQQDVKDHILATYTGDNVRQISFITRSTTITITGVTGVSYDVFKTRAGYWAGVVFMDFGMRRGGVVTSDGAAFEIPSRDFDFTNAITSVTWTLSNANALAEIPDWAVYYAPVRTLNLKTRFFIDALTNAAKYATRDADGAFEYTNNLFVVGTVGIALRTDALFQAGLGYTFAQGDVAVLTLDDDTIYELPVIAQDANYVIVSPEDIGDLSNLLIEYQIYNPYKASEQESFFEIGDVYLVDNPGTGSRAYSVLTDIFLPDSYVLSRNFNVNTYFAEAMSPNDLFYKRWDNDGGKPNFITKLGQVQKTNFGRYSDTFIPGTQTNGLSTYDAPNQFDVPEDSGIIQKFVLTSKIQDEGNVMLAICTHETNSVYIGEVRIQDSGGKTQFIAAASGVVGTINNLKGSRGTINPESVFEFLGLVSWIDILNGDIIQYSNNGLDVVSMNGMERFFRNYSLGYNAASTGNLDNINGFHHIPSGVDPFHKEFIFSLPGLIYPNYADTLPSYTSAPSYATSIINRFDVYDQLAKTMSYNFMENKWGSNYEAIAEWYEWYQNTLIGFKNGVPYVHNEDTDNWNTWYGQQYPIRICLAANMGSSALKQLNNIAVEGLPEVPNFTVALTNVPNLQISDLSDENYTNQEGVLYATFLRDRLSPSITGSVDRKMNLGDVLTDFSIFVMCEWQQYEQLMWVNYIDIGYSISKGQKQIII